MDDEAKTPQSNLRANVDLISAPSLSLPKGGGAIRGIGEKFVADSMTGTASMSVPIDSSPGRDGFGPELSLNYSSGAGNSIFGFGWNLDLPSVSRKTEKGLPRYGGKADSDVFILSGAEDLVPFLDKSGQGWEASETQLTVDTVTYLVTRYRPRIEGLFARIEKWSRLDNGDTHWQTISRDNVLTIYGMDENSRIYDPDNPEHIFSWLINESRDDKGNAIVYEYKAEDGTGVDLSKLNERNRGKPNQNGRTAQRYIKRIKYGNLTTLLGVGGQRPRLLSSQQIANAEWMFELVFDYGEHDSLSVVESAGWTYRKDPFSDYKPGFEVRTTRLCQRVLMFHHFDGESEVGLDCLVRSTDFHYAFESRDDPIDAIYSFLYRVTRIGYKRDGSGYLRRSLPPLDFDYALPTVQSDVKTVDPRSMENLPIGVDGSEYQWSDIFGEGTPGVLTEQGGVWFYKRNYSPIGDGEVVLQPVEKLAVQPNLSLASNAQVLDLAGDGQPDIVALEGPELGLYENDGEEGWKNFKRFTSCPNVDFKDPNLKFLDLDGDGYADILITEDEVLVWHQSLGEAGFGTAKHVAQALDEEKGPKVVFADGAQSIYLADLSGDGLTDILRIRNGDVCYWPNLGYGRFGKKVGMDQAPYFDNPQQFNQNRIRVADIDGSGTADIIYLHSEGIRLYFNESGNSWSAPKELNHAPKVDDIVKIYPTDLLGNGTVCLVWSSPLPGDAGHALRYINLMGDIKPHLLVKTDNNLGLQTEVYYAPSTKFYLQDKLAGKPWVTKLPFPVHVVEKVIVSDKWRKTTFSTAYSYHHGYYDGVEREFRGFGRVEQVDVQDFKTFAKGNIDSPYITDDQTLYQPPVKTISWFHTGAYFERDLLLSKYTQEFFTPDSFEENKTTSSLFKGEGIPRNEQREAYRACKGRILRTETYELDVDRLSLGENIPVKLFGIQNTDWSVVGLQPRQKNKHAVFLVNETESITYHYDLNLLDQPVTPDPRITHSLVLKADQYGHVLQSVAIGYPRIGLFEDSSLQAEDLERIRSEQQKLSISYTDSRFTNDIDDQDNYRLRAVCEASTFEIGGVTPSIALLSNDQPQYFSHGDFTRYRLNSSHQSIGEVIEELSYHQLPDKSVAQKRLIDRRRILFFNDNRASPGFLQDPLDFGVQCILGLTYETYSLAFTETLLEAVLDAKLTPEVTNSLGEVSLSGYLSGSLLASRFTSENVTGEYWIQSGVEGFASDAAQHFFTPERYIDPFGVETIIEYDARDLFVQSSTDAVGNTELVRQFDYRVLSARELEDINGNLSEVVFDALGFPAATAVKGKGAEADSLVGFDASIVDPNHDQLIEFFVTPPTDTETLSGYQLKQRNEAGRLLFNATARHLYYFGQVETTLPNGNTEIQWGVHPASSCGVAREQHVTRVSSGGVSPLQISFEYSDGSGQSIVTKMQAESDAAAGPLRWIANGKSIYNNKGNVVKQYEPYFTTLHTFQDPLEVGVTLIHYYDAANRNVRTEHPDGTFNRSEFSPWLVTTYDQNDTILEQGNDWFQRRNNPAHPRFAEFDAASHRHSLVATLEHANTPTQTCYDSLGREVTVIDHNRIQNEFDEWVDDKYVSHTKLDIEGNELWIKDARANFAEQYIIPAVASDSLVDPSGFVPCYDIAGNLLYQSNQDAGERWMLPDSTGQTLYAWDINEKTDNSGSTFSENRRYQIVYDSLRRPREKRLKIDSNQVQTIERFVYGEPDAGSANSIALKLQAQQKNLLGKLNIHFDSSGRIINNAFDFSGNLLKSSKQFSAVFDQPILSWQEDNSDEGLLSETFTLEAEYDALGRTVRQYQWHRDTTRVSVVEPFYNERGLLQSQDIVLNADTTVASGDLPYTGTERKQFVTEISYDAKGQKQHQKFDNGTRTRYRYDPESFRLTQVRTTRPDTYDPAFPSHRAGLNDSSVVQQLLYCYDPIGNICEIRDDAYQPVFFDNQLVEPHCRYSYDALYRLTEATGRESAAQNAAPSRSGIQTLITDFPQGQGTLRNYTQTYQYDKTSNLIQQRHSAGSGSWTRNFDYASDSNRLERTWTGSDVVNAVIHRHDLHGNMLNLSNVADPFTIKPDYRDMVFHLDLGGGGDAWYAYDAENLRTRKRIVRNNGALEERLYLGAKELYRRFHPNGNLIEEIETHHLSIDDQRVLMVDNVIQTDNTQLGTGTLFRYQYSNHQGSVALELDHVARIVSLEEFHPFGTTAFHLSGRGIRATAKRYRYTGMEKDLESGLNYHTARYFAPWLCRWCSTDPDGLADGLNLYSYAQSNPVTMSDRGGKESWKDSLSMSERFALWVDEKVGSENMQHAANFSAGMGDAVSMGATQKVREVMGTDNVVQHDSAMYRGGQVTGEVVRTVATGGAPAAAVINVAKDQIKDEILEATGVNDMVADGVGQLAEATGVNPSAVLMISQAAEMGKKKKRRKKRKKRRVKSNNKKRNSGSSNNGDGSGGNGDGGGNSKADGRLGAAHAAPGKDVEFSQPANPKVERVRRREKTDTRSGADTKEVSKGTLTKQEMDEIQAVADKHKTTIDVVGSRAAGEGRNVETDFPVGKGDNTRSDIDFRIDTEHENVGELISDLKAVGNGAGSASRRHGTNHRPTSPPFIRTKPKN